jgi:hypothetical protein
VYLYELHEKMNFPREIDRFILSLIDPRDLNNYELTCKKEYLNPRQDIWKKFLLGDLKKIREDILSFLKIDETDYKETYLSLIVPVRRISIYLDIHYLSDTRRHLKLKIPENVFDWFKLIHDGDPYNDKTDIQTYIKNQHQKAICRKYSEYRRLFGPESDNIDPFLIKYVYNDQKNHALVKKYYHKESNFCKYVFNRLTRRLARF